MFDSVKKSTQQDSKQNAGAWGQPVTEVHSSTDVNADSKTYHPTKPVKAKKSTLPILLGLLFLIILAGGGYWWYTNYYASTESAVENNIVATDEKKIVEEEEVVLVFPDDYFLTEEEMPEGFSAATDLEELKEEIDDLIFIYDNINIEGIEESWGINYNKEDGSEYGISIAALRYKSDELLELEVEKIKNTGSTPFYNEDGRVSFIRKGNVLLILANDYVDVVELDILVTAFENKLETTKIKTIQGQSSQEKLEYMTKLTERVFLCLIVSEPKYLSYFPKVDRYSQYYSLAENMDEDQKVTYINDECSIIRREETDMNDIKRVLGTDEDGDGLTLYFEREYFTDDNNPDTDGDGYSDLAEIENGYSPIVDEANLEIYIGENGHEYIVHTDNQFFYSVLLPRDWASMPGAWGSEGGVHIWPGEPLVGNHSISISVMVLENFDDEMKENILSGGGYIEVSYEEYILAGLPAYIKSDQSTVVLFKESSIEGNVFYFVFMYDHSLADEANVEYREVFEEMLASFKFLEAGDNAPVNALAVKTRNAQRQVDVNVILNAIYQYSIDNDGNLPENITEIEREICVSDINKADCGNLAWLGELLENKKYLISMPEDPGGSCSSNGTCYTVMRASGDRVIVSAPDAEGVIIEVKK